MSFLIDKWLNKLYKLLLILRLQPTIILSLFNLLIWVNNMSENSEHFPSQVTKAQEEVLKLPVLSEQQYIFLFFFTVT